MSSFPIFSQVLHENSEQDCAGCRGCLQAEYSIYIYSTHSDIKIESNSGQYMFGFNNQKANLKKKKYNIFVLNNQKANL